MKTFPLDMSKYWLTIQMKKCWKLKLREVREGEMCSSGAWDATSVNIFLKKSATAEEKKFISWRVSGQKAHVYLKLFMAILPPTGEIIVLDKHIRNALFSIYQKSFQRFIHFSVLWHRHCHAVTSSPSSPHAAKSAQLCFRNSPCIVFCQCSSQPAPLFLLPSRCDSLTTCHCKSFAVQKFSTATWKMFSTGGWGEVTFVGKGSLSSKFEAMKA